jgi:hypothetical protein
LVGARLPLQLTRQTPDLMVADVWMKDYALAPVGVEGVVATGAGDPDRPDQRGWVEVKIRDTADALVVAVVGRLERPTRRVLGRLVEARLQIVGSTRELRPAHQVEFGAVLVAADEHP